jgi:SAM-dependent methyltransferase
MPDEEAWRAFFDADCMITIMGCAQRGDESIVEFGSGYGTFTLPVARRTSGIVHAFDIETDLVALVQRKARDAGLANVRAERRDFVGAGTGLSTASVDHAMVWNLLHLKRPHILLDEAQRVLRPGGTLSIVHWQHDAATPRGPPLQIRPRPQQCIEWARVAAFELLREADLSACCRWHYGLLFKKI